MEAIQIKTRRMSLTSTILMNLQRKASRESKSKARRKNSSWTCKVTSTIWLVTSSALQMEMEELKVFNKLEGTLK